MWFATTTTTTTTTKAYLKHSLEIITKPATALNTMRGTAGELSVNELNIASVSVDMQLVKQGTVARLAANSITIAASD